eukprot:gene13662-biopygen510
MSQESGVFLRTGVGRTVNGHDRITGRNGCGRVPDASHTIEFEETDASRARPQPFLAGHWRRRGADYRHCFWFGWRGRGAGMARTCPVTPEPDLSQRVFWSGTG